MSNFSKVGIFMKTFGQEVKDKPSFSSDKINKLRIDLIKEELNELTEAMKNNDLLEASGNINLKTVKSVAATGVNRISVGSITHSALAIDLKLDI